MESELIALDTTCIENEWIKSLLLDIPLVSKLYLLYLFIVTEDLQLI